MLLRPIEGCYRPFSVGDCLRCKSECAEDGHGENCNDFQSAGQALARAAAAVVAKVIRDLQHVSLPEYPRTVLAYRQGQVAASMTETGAHCVDPNEEQA